MIQRRFFSKARFSLQFLISTHKRNPYFASIFNSYRSEIIEYGYLGLEQYGTVCVTVESMYSSNNQRMKDNEELLMSQELLLKDYYKDISEKMPLFNSKSLCDTLNTVTSSFNVDGCKNDMQKMMLRGVRECLSVAINSVNMMYMAYISEPNITNEIIFSKYINDSLVLNLCKLQSNCSGHEEYIYRGGIEVYSEQLLREGNRVLEMVLQPAEDIIHRVHHYNLLHLLLVCADAHLVLEQGHTES
eukprot:TRINITY_DN16485_c0_g3_i5.p1 TRINITY_DN16485_c0_g3~~TRINITY_DN16485_c0_g3_i5.p1  ORF type:complete len:245 (-),score=16.47 TRINITY_DN16485_c0_g3_i5:218-952(-)